MAKRARPPAAARAATNTERGRAAKARARVRAGVARRGDRALLRDYDRARKVFASRPAVLAPRSSARQDAARFARSLGGWLGAPTGQTSKTLRRADSAHSVRGIGTSDVTYDGLALLGVGELGEPPELRGSGRSIGVRAELVRDDGSTQWVTLNALTPDWDDALASVYEALDESLEAYNATAIVTISVIAR